MTGIILSSKKDYIITLLCDGNIRVELFKRGHGSPKIIIDILFIDRYHDNHIDYPCYYVNFWRYGNLADYRIFDLPFPIQAYNQGITISRILKMVFKQHGIKSSIVKSHPKGGYPLINFKSNEDRAKFLLHFGHCIRGS